MESLSICHLCFLSSVSCSFLYTALLSPWTGLFLVFYSSCCSGKWDWFLNFSDFSLLVYRNARDLCVMILYPVTLLNSLISSSNFLIMSLGFSMYSILSANSESFTSFLLRSFTSFLFFNLVLDSFYFFFFSDCHS